MKANGSVSYQSVKSRLVSFNVYYDDLMYTMIQHSPKLSVLDLISNIGGILGICMVTNYFKSFKNNINRQMFIF